MKQEENIALAIVGRRHISRRNESSSEIRGENQRIESLHFKAKQNSDFNEKVLEEDVCQERDQGLIARR